MPFLFDVDLLAEDGAEEEGASIAAGRRRREAERLGLGMCGIRRCLLELLPADDSLDDMGERGGGNASRVGLPSGVAAVLPLDFRLRDDDDFFLFLSSPPASPEGRRSVIDVLNLAVGIDVIVVEVTPEAEARPLILPLSVVPLVFAFFFVGAKSGLTSSDDTASNMESFTVARSSFRRFF